MCLFPEENQQPVLRGHVFPKKSDNFYWTGNKNTHFTDENQRTFFDNVSSSHKIIPLDILAIQQTTRSRSSTSTCTTTTIARTSERRTGWPSHSTIPLHGERRWPGPGRRGASRTTRRRCGRPTGFLEPCCLKSGTHSHVYKMNCHKERKTPST